MTANLPDSSYFTKNAEEEQTKELLNKFDNNKKNYQKNGIIKPSRVGSELKKYISSNY